MSTPPPPMPASSSPAPVQQPALSEPARLINVFVAPSKTFTDIRRNASWWVPLVIISILSISFFVMIDKKVGFDQVARHMMESNSRIQQLPPEQQERTMTMAANGMKYGGYASPIIVLVYALIIAAVLFFSFNFLLDAQIEFSRALAVVMYGWLPSCIGVLLSMLTLAFGNPEGFRMENPVGTNPAYFLDFGTTSKFVYVMLQSLDVISLWIVVLIGLGFALNAKKKISTASAITVVAAWFFIYKFVSAGWAAMRS